jgi:hypothetical protein
MNQSSVARVNATMDLRVHIKMADITVYVKLTVEIQFFILK